MNKTVGICWECEIIGDSEDRKCFKCGKKMQETDIKAESYDNTYEMWAWEVTDRYIMWRYAKSEEEKEIVRQLIKGVPQERLEHYLICPRCGWTWSTIEQDDECSNCGCTMIPVKSTIGEILEKAGDPSRLKQQLYNENCYGNPLFDQYEFHKRRIEMGEEEDPNAKLAEMIGEEVREANRSKIQFGFGHFFDL
ncbi:hypothetical protein [Hominifimenecus sp. rT4P-3]|uniref:hypothetical protein n=1 Tax=Hominifimenecus sp. rT4P-3 TaxID=3242979 RepID=UPI003DA5DC01